VVNGKKTGGRKKGTPNKRSAEIATYAKGVMEDPKVQAMILAQAQNGTLPAPLVQMLCAYAYGRPHERIEHSMDQEKPLVIRMRYGPGSG
jgi:hypothetical protein